MSDRPTLPPTKERPPQNRPAAGAPQSGKPPIVQPERRLNPVLLLTLAGFVILAAAIVWLFVNQRQVASEPSVDPATFAASQQQVEALTQRVARAEQRPVVTQPDLKPLENRIAALENRPPPPEADLGPIEDRLTKLEQRPQVPANVATRDDLKGLATKDELAKFAVKDDLAKFATKDELGKYATKDDLTEFATRANVAAFQTRIDALAGREDQLANRQQGLETNLGNKLDTLSAQADALERDKTSNKATLADLQDKAAAEDKRLGTIEQKLGQVPALAEKAVRIGRIQAAESALERGQPIGDVPDAPPALDRFAKTAPPTEAELRLEFPQAARAANEASRPPTQGKPFLDRMWLRAQELVTLREGDRVLVGDPAAGVIARARQALVAGDLAGAVSVLDTLPDPVAPAMAEWQSKAKSLLEARAALASLAAHP